MDAKVLDAPREVGAPLQVENSEEGRVILAKVRHAISAAVYEVVPIKRIRPMPNQPRKHFNTERLLRLADSIKQVGQITPGYLREVDPDKEGRDRELVDGERRWRAILMSGVPTFRAMRVQVDDESAQYIVSVIANFNREGHTVLEIADSIRVMHQQLKLSMPEIAESIGYHPIYVTNLYGLRRLVPEVRAMLDPELENNRRLPVSAAIEISRLPEQYQLPLAERVMSREVNLRGLRGAVKEIATTHGIPVRERRKDAHDQRRTIERKIDAFLRQSIDLKDRMEEVPISSLRHWSNERAKAYLGQLTQAEENVLKARKVINAVLRNP